MDGTMSTPQKGDAQEAIRRRGRLRDAHGEAARSMSARTDMRHQPRSATGLARVADLLRWRFWRIGARPDGERERPRLVGLAAVFACASLAGSLAAPSSFALTADGNGNYTQILCANPASEEGLGVGDARRPQQPREHRLWQVATSEVNCAGGHITPNRGVPMAVGQTNTYAQGTWSALLYQAPASVTINGGKIYRAEKAEGANDGFMGINQQGGEYDNLYSLPRNGVDQGDWFSGNTASRGTFSWPFSPENIVNLTISPDGGHWDVNATCDPNGNNNSSCTLTADSGNTASSAAKSASTPARTRRRATSPAH